MILMLNLIEFCNSENLQKEFPGAHYIAMDTVCQYWPWLLRKNPMMHGRHQPLLSVMHAKAHSWSCQVSAIMLSTDSCYIEKFILCYYWENVIFNKVF